MANPQRHGQYQSANMTEIRRNKGVLVTWIHGSGTFVTVPWGISAHSLLHGHRSPYKSWEAQNVHSFSTEATHGASGDQHNPLCPSGWGFHGHEAHWVEHFVQLSATLLALFLLNLIDTLPRWDVLFVLPWIHLCWFGIKALSGTVLGLSWTLQWKHHKHPQVHKHHSPCLPF